MKEKHLWNLRKKFYPKLIDCVQKKTYDFIAESRLEDIAIHFSEIAYANFFNMDLRFMSIESFEDIFDDKIDYYTRISVENTQKSVSGLLYRYLIDTGQLGKRN